MHHTSKTKKISVALIVLLSAQQSTRSMLQQIVAHVTRNRLTLASACVLGATTAYLYRDEISQKLNPQKIERDARALAAQILQGEKTTPESTVLLFDLHEVLAHAKKVEIARNFLAIPERARFLKAAIQKRLPQDLAIQEQDIVDDAYLAYRTQGIKTINTYQVDPAMLALIQELKRQGYHLVLFSNISLDCFEDLRKKESFEALFGLFDNFAISCAENGWIKKSEPRAFEYAAQLARKTTPEAKFLLFIDDKAKNIKRAEGTMHGLHFKSSQKLRTQLEALEIL